MKKNISLPMVLLLALVASNSFAFVSCFHEGEANWYVMPKVGVAPSFFVPRATHQSFVVPGAAFDSINDGVLTQFVNVFQDGPCLPKFNDMFSQGVLHVGLEIGRNICDRSEIFLEFVYNRASGKCHNYCDTFVTGVASAGCPGSNCGDCSDDCSSSCSSSSCSSSCCPTTGTTSLSVIQSMRDSFSNYQALGGYIGARHFTNRFWCDSMSFWYGYKFGMLHRKAVSSCGNLVYNTATPLSQCATLESLVNRNVFCKSNSVSGGLQLGFDYCYCDNLSFQLGFELVASAGLRGNRNHPIDRVQCSGVDLPLRATVPTNISVCNSGTVLNFPIWLGLTWEFGGCFSRCN